MKIDTFYQEFVFTDCNFTGNEAQIGGGFIIAVLFPFYAQESSETTTVTFCNCTFNGNRAEASAAVDIYISRFFHALVEFHQCQFKNNILSNSQSKIANSVVSVVNVAVTFINEYH